MRHDRLYQVVARLLHAYERRDTLAQESAEAEREMEVVPAEGLHDIGMES